MKHKYQVPNAYYECSICTESGHELNCHEPAELRWCKDGFYCEVCIDCDDHFNDIPHEEKWKGLTLKEYQDGQN